MRQKILLNSSAKPYTGTIYLPLLDRRQSKGDGKRNRLRATVELDAR